MPFRKEDFSVGWICAIDTEYVVACELLDEEYGSADVPRVNTDSDHNIYTFGRIHEHNIVIACLPNGRYGVTSAAIVGRQMRSSFPGLRFGLMVGIAGGAPSSKHDIRLGDIVVSSPALKHGGVIQYDFGKATQGCEFEEIGHLTGPPQILLSAVMKLKTEHRRNGHRLKKIINEWLEKSPRLRGDYSQPSVSLDKLYKSSYVHSKQSPCLCQINDLESSSENSSELPIVHRDKRLKVDEGASSEASLESMIVHRNERPPGDESLHIHYGLIAAGNTLMKDATIRDRITQKHGILCFEMEAAGLMNDFPCLVIRGICDYCDSHKNDLWQGYAAATATAFAKELLRLIPGKELEPKNGGLRSYNKISDHVTRDAVDRADAAIRKYYGEAERFKIERLSGDILPLDKCYVNLILKEVTAENQQGLKKPTFSLKERLRVDAGDEHEEYSLSRLFETRNSSDAGCTNPRRIFIQGRAGVGKTTLCKKMVHEFLQHRLGHTLFDRLLWLPLRDLKKQDARYGWLELLRDVFPLSTIDSEWDHLITVMAEQIAQPEFRKRTLLVFDGLDEVSRDWKHGDKIFQMLETVISTASNIIITSRPRANSLKVGKFDLELETRGFTPNQIDTYIDHCVPNEHIRSTMKNLIAAKPVLQGLLCIPVQLDAFCCTWSSDAEAEFHKASSNDFENLQKSRGENLPVTMTTLYWAITTELCRKDLKYMGKHHDPQVLQTDELQDLLAVELKFLEELAFQGLTNAVIDFSPSHQESIHLHFKRCGNILPHPYSSTLEKLSFVRTSSIQQHQRRRNYHFLHLTFQEFFAARHFVRFWRTKRNLECLDLTNLGSSKITQISPFRFLQEAKYDPRYNIFWRFVTGLTQLPHESELVPCLSTLDDHDDTLLLFSQIDSEPVDLVGSTHCRLLMYCLSEVVPAQDQSLRTLRKRMEKVLYNAAVSEFQMQSKILLAQEAEFPESVIFSLLDGEEDLLLKAVLATVEWRPLIGSETSEIAMEIMNRPFALSTRVAAAQVTLKHLRMKSKKSFADMITSLLGQLTDKDDSLRTFAKQVLLTQHHLPIEATTSLLNMLKDEDTDVKSSAREILGQQYSLSQETLMNLILLVTAKEANVCKSAAEILRRQRRLPTEAAATLIAALRHEDISVQLDFAHILEHCVFESDEEVSLMLATELRDGDSHSRCSVSKILVANGFFTQEAIAAMIIGCKDQDLHVRKSCLTALKFGSDLPVEAIAAFMTALNDEDEMVRWNAAFGLSSQSSLPAEYITALLEMFRTNTEPLVKRNATQALSSQTSLPVDAIPDMLEALKNDDHFVRYSTARLLGNQSSLPGDAVTALVTALKDDADSHVREQVSKALCKQSSLTAEVINTLATALESNQGCDVQARAAEVIIAKSSVHAVTVLVAALENALCSASWYDISKALSQRRSLPVESFPVLISHLQKLEVYEKAELHRILHRHDVYSRMEHCDHNSWQQLWSYWKKHAADLDLCCYQFEGSLYVWSAGHKYTISSNAQETQ